METKHTYTHKKNIKINMVLLDSPVIRQIIMLNFDKLYSLSGVHRKGRLMLYNKIARENYSGRTLNPQRKTLVCISVQITAWLQPKECPKSFSIKTKTPFKIMYIKCIIPNLFISLNFHLIKKEF